MTDEPGDRDAVLEGLWSRACEAWDDDKVHGAVLEYALRSEQLPEVARRYRALLEHPEKGAKAKKRIDAIVVTATQRMLAAKSEPRRKTPGWVTGTAVLVCVALMSLLTYALVFKR